MTRLAYRTALALLLTANAVGLATLVEQGHGLPPLLGAVSLAYIGLVVLAYALGAAWHVGRVSGGQYRRRRYLGSYSHAARSAAVRATAPVELGPPPRHAAAMAAVTADANARVANAWQHRFAVEVVDGAAPEQPGAAALPPTKPMPVIDLGTFDLSECRVSEYEGTR